MVALWLAATSIADAQTFRRADQTFRQSGKTISDLCSNENVVSVEGDFNNDGIKDLFLNIHQEACAFYFGKADGGYKLFRDYDLHLSDKAKLSVTDKGVLRIQIGSEDSDIFLYRFQNNAFVLIGGKKDRHKSEHYDESYNFLTGKKIETKGEGASRKSETISMPKQPEFRFGWHPLNWDIMFLVTIIDEYGGMAPEDMLSFGIYRRMQLEERLEWFLCDPNSDRGIEFPCVSRNGTGSVNSVMMRPGMENMSLTITFTKMPNGKYKIVSEADIEDRSYENKYDAYISEHPEASELPVDEVCKKAGIQLVGDKHNVYTEYFDDGKFITE